MIIIVIIETRTETIIEGRPIMNELAVQSAITATTQTPTFAQITAHFLTTLDASEKTKQTYARALKRWGVWLEQRELTFLQATRQSVLEYKQSLADTHKPATINGYLSALRAFYSWLESEGIMPNVAASIKNAKTSAQSSKDALTIEQARSLAKLYANAKTLEGKRNHAILNLMLNAGLRCIEVARAQVEDLRTQNGKAVLFVQGKGRAAKDSFVVLPESVLTAIYSYINARKESGEEVTPKSALFAGTSNKNHGRALTTRTINNIATAAFKTLGIKTERLTAHSLRHTAVTLALLGGASVQAAQAMARHANIQTTMIYAHNLDRVANAAENSVNALLQG
jgi:integrase/recombinase XerC/integrase/recombinase XerD